MTVRRPAGTLATATLSIVLGLGVAFVDSRPGWDDTGITAAVLFGGALVLSLVAGRRPWVWGLLVGIWIPVFEIRSDRDLAAVAALVFAFGGAFTGWAASRLLREQRGASPSD
jgi:hypothetical protein